MEAHKYKLLKSCLLTFVLDLVLQLIRIVPNRRWSLKTSLKYKRLRYYDSAVIFRSSLITIHNAEFRTKFLNASETESREQKPQFLQSTLNTSLQSHALYWHRGWAKTKPAKNYFVSSFLKHWLDTILNINFPLEEERIHLFSPSFNNAPSGFSAWSLTKHYVLWKEELTPDVFKYN